MNLYLIRHGKTEANEKHLYCGSTDLPLSPAGIAELEDLKEVYPKPEHCRFITSGMLRAEQTLEILFGAVRHRIEPDLREVDFGIFEMHSYEELKDDPAYQQWINGDNDANIAPGGESGNEMEKRVWNAFSRLTASEQDTVIVTHGGVIAVLMARLFSEESKNRYQWQPKPGHGYLLTAEHYIPIP